MDEVDLDEDEMVDVGMPIHMQVLNHAKKEIERRQHIGSFVVLCQVVHALHLNQILSACLYSRVTYSPQSKHRRCELMSYLVHTVKCRVGTSYAWGSIHATLSKTKRYWYSKGYYKVYSRSASGKILAYYRT
jgi:hypothetical protein